MGSEDMMNSHINGVKHMKKQLAAEQNQPMDEMKGKQKKCNEKPYYCELCMIGLNSEDTMNSHINGIKHMKKQWPENQQMKEMKARGKKDNKRTYYCKLCMIELN